MKKEEFLGIIFLLSIGLTSAYGGSYNNFSISGLFSELNVSMFLTALLFSAIFAVIYFIVGKSPLGENRAVSWIVSLCAAAFSLWGILRSGFSFENFLYQLGLAQDSLPIFLWIVGIVLCVFLIWKFKFKRFIGIVFLLAGSLLVILSILDQVYEKGVGIMIGIAFILIGMFLSKKKDGNFQEDSRTFRFGKKLGYGMAYASSKPKFLCFIVVLLGIAALYFGVSSGEIIIMAIGLIVFLLGIKCLFKRKVIPKQYAGRVQGYPPRDSPQNSSPNTSPEVVEREKLIYQKRQRSIYDLKQKYIAYGNRFNQVSRSNSQEAKRILEAMEIITNMAKKQGVKEGEFLSNKYIMNYKSVREIRGKSGY
ncbi:MAG: hypothetical protein NUV46_02655 [Nanoarchaeota archaeon]|nr:hypothetical protein [Nanoarchaeota archaeon]